MRILGVSSFYHDSAAALIVDGEIVAAAQEERFTRIKHDAGFPEKAIAYCLKEGEVALQDIDQVVFYDKPFLKFERLLETYLSFAPKGFKSFKMAVPIWLKEKLFQKDLLRRKFKEFDSTFDWQNKLLFSEHHLSHAASAFYPSPYDKAIVLTMDGVGEWAASSVAIGNGNKLDIVKEMHFPHSLGLLYSAFTYYTGFRVNSGEYKVMGLAPYGEPKFKELILDKLVDLKEDGSFRMDQDYFNYCTGLTMTNDKFAELFGRPARRPDVDKLEQFHMDVAASVQAVAEEIVLRITRSLAKEYPDIPNLCLAGGVALNCVANGKILRDNAFKNIWIQPAAGDAGGALGAALNGYYFFNEKERTVTGKDHMKGSYLGPVFDEKDIQLRLQAVGAVYNVAENVEAMIEACVDALEEEKVVGWFQGRMEFGPRALGGRSIIGDPRSEEMQKTMNLKIKYRESFRPFAPSVRAEDVSDWFDLDTESPYMLIVSDVAQKRRKTMTEEEEALFGIDKLNVVRSEIPAVTHVDYSARIQTIHKETNPKYHALVSRFKERCGSPVVVNTSFNVRGEPIVCTPEDAFRCFMGTEMDVLVLGNCVLKKNEQNPRLALDYKNAFTLD
ncbi:carbamoyltransferase [Terasakiella sp.]|uniref:carbamoyltransferase family protein n=1 Tax=Terasakiella sp. TaxID=2034861 RepID=UPI003AA7EB46